MKRLNPTATAFGKVERIRSEAVRLGWTSSALWDLACLMKDEEETGRITFDAIEILNGTVWNYPKDEASDAKQEEMLFGPTSSA